MNADRRECASRKRHLLSRSCRALLLAVVLLTGLLALAVGCANPFRADAYQYYYSNLRKSYPCGFLAIGSYTPPSLGKWPTAWIHLSMLETGYQVPTVETLFGSREETTWTPWAHAKQDFLSSLDPGFPLFQRGRKGFLVDHLLFVPLPKGKYRLEKWRFDWIEWLSYNTYIRHRVWGDPGQEFNIEQNTVSYLGSFQFTDEDLKGVLASGICRITRKDETREIRDLLTDRIRSSKFVPHESPKNTIVYSSKDNVLDWVFHDLKEATGQGQHLRIETSLGNPILMSHYGESHIVQPRIVIYY